MLKKSNFRPVVFAYLVGGIVSFFIFLVMNDTPFDNIGQNDSVYGVL
jgi:hypothetical protein